MDTQHQHQSDSSTQGAAKSKQQSQQRRVAHTNSARAGEDPTRGDDSRDAGGAKGQRGPQ
jgi:hypothetical protein